ncbi:MAG: phosphotransferase family protein [Mycobacterium sp.]|uniref:phosphotransferase family protein n=1 Tax=Mycobacterium sp. TaxID=1785 RepID=UPI00389B1304
MALAVPIPRHPADVTSEWLSAVLDADVRHVDVAPIGTGQTGATYRVSATYETECNLPGTFAIKLPAQDDTVRERVALGYLSEVEFYTDVAEKVHIPIPACFHSDISDSGADFVLVLADMAPAVQGDQIAGCTPQEARLAVEALAGLHGPSWCDPVWLGLSAISMPKPGDEAAAKGLGDVSVMAADITIDKLGARMNAEDRETLSTAMALVTPWLMAEPKRYALMHGDYRLDNMLFDPDHTRVTVVDWQTMGVGLPARDLAYFTATSLAPEARSETEQDLVGMYHKALLGYGVTDYDADTCWRDYRLGVIQAPLITGLGFAFAASTERGDEMILTMLHRGCRAIRELGTLDLINDYQSI